LTGRLEPLCRSENRDKIETYLAMGASRFEACKPIGKEALKLALLPTINQMRSVSMAFMLHAAICSGADLDLIV